MKTLILGLIAAASVVSALPAAAQPVAPPTAPPAAVQAHQQAAIQQGARTGVITPRQTAHLERREAKLHRVEVRLRAKHGGKLTRHDRRVLARIEARDGRAIHHAVRTGPRAS